MSRHLPLTHALAWIVGSTFCFTALSHNLLKHYFHPRSKPISKILYIIQTGPQKEALKTDYLAELLDLCSDHPTPLSTFDLKNGEKKLLNSPFISKAHLRLLAPSTLYIDYTVRQPVALLHDYENTAIDKEGYLFPIAPFFTPKNLPEIYFGLQVPCRYHTPLTGKALTLAFDLIERLSPIRPRRVDVSHAFAESYGQRQIVLLIDDHILRLPTKDYPKQLANYLHLRPQLPPNTTTIDLRLSNLAFLNKE